MLVTELDFKMKNLLAVALEPKVPGLDDAGMHRSNGDFVNLLALDAVERIRLTVSAPGIRRANRAQPGMSFGLYAGLLVKLALKVVHAGSIVGERAIGPAPFCGKHCIS